jgi:divalent metal cation (Fe/Co/Zn/Cd) transporter
VVIEVDPRLNIVEGHQISDEIKERLTDMHKIMFVRGNGTLEQNIA